MVKKKEEKLRKDFYSFQSKVNTLEEIRNELKELDTRGFEKEVSIIKSRLKDTTAIPELEKLMTDLRRKILNKRPVKRKSPLKEIEKDVADITDTNLEIKKEIKNIKFSIDDKINKKIKTDSELSLSVDEGFQDFVNSLKLELSQKLKNKENQLNNELKQDLLVRRRDLELKYKKLEDKLKQDYNNKYKTELQKKIQEKFSEELRKRFEAERARLDLFYVARLKQKYKEEFERSKRALESEFRRNFDEELKRRDAENKRKVAEIESIYSGKIREMERSKRDFYSKNNEKQKILDKKLKDLEILRNSQVKSLNEYQNQIKKKLAEEEHKNLFSRLNSEKLRLNEELKRQFESKMNNFVAEQKKQQAREINERTKQVRESMERENKINTLLNHNLSEKTYALEKQKEMNRELIANMSRLKSEEMKKRMEEHKLAVQQHKRDIQSITDRLKNSFHNRFDSEVKKYVSEEKQRLQNEFDLKRKEMSEKVNAMSIRERLELRRKLKQEYNINLIKNTEAKKKKLQEQFRREFGHQANEQILLEKKKLDNKIKELEAKYSARESELRLREKALIQNLKSKSLDIANEKKKLLEKMNLFKKEENSKMKNERVKLQKEFAAKAHEEMLQELKRREEAIRINLQKSFDDKMKDVAKAQEEQLSRKKAELAHELERKAKSLMN